MKTVAFACLQRVFLYLVAFTLFGQCRCIAQPIEDSLRLFRSDAIEQLQEQLPEGESFEWNGEEILPFSIHTVTAHQLRWLNVLTEQQIQQFLYYRATYGPFITLYELQAVPHLDLTTIHMLLPYLTLREGLDDYQIPLRDMWRAGRRELYLRWSRILEKQKGYDLGSSNRYLGAPDQFSFRFRHQHSNKLSVGLVGEKDRGEPFFKAGNRYGFDFYSGHFFLRSYNQWLKALAVGDYKVSFGEGLLVYQGFSGGKGAAATSLKKARRVLAPHQSTGESRFLRGVGTTLQFLNWQWTIFSGWQKRDGRLDKTPDSTIVIRALYEDGLHRSQSEMERKRVVQQWTTGQRLQWQYRTLQLSLNTLLVAFDNTLRPALQPYNQYHFRGRRQLNHSIDYSFRYRNMHLFGEAAISQNGAMASVSGLLLGLGPRLELSVLHRSYSRRFHSLMAAAFGENSRIQNEKGLYFGVQFRPWKGIRISAYADHWRHPWFQFQADAPSRGRDYRVRLTHTKKRTYEVYLEYRDKTKEVNAPNEVTQTNFLVPERTVQLRLHANRMLSKRLELRSRIDVGFADSPIHNRQRGFSAFQDVLYRPVAFPLSFTFRFAIFDTDGYQTRYYNYENNLLNSFAIPAYYNRGTRWYLNLRYKAGKRWTLETRVAQTKWEDQTTIGSGTEATIGPTKTEISVQIRYQVEAKK